MNNFLFYLAAFALVLGVLVLVHEYGHYLAARAMGVKVLRFSLGFGRPVWSKRFGADQTEWAIGAFPLGGYVKMLDEREGEVPEDELPRSFNRQSVYKRIVIVAAGPLANFVLAIAAYWFVFCYGMQEPLPILAEPPAASAAAQAGIKAGDLVLQVGKTSVPAWQHMRWEILHQATGRDQIVLKVKTSSGELAERALGVEQIKMGGWEGDLLAKLGIGLNQPIIPPIVGKFLPGSVAEEAGLLPGDLIVSIDKKPIVTWPELVRIVQNSPGAMLEVEIERQGKRYLTDIVPVPVEKNGTQIGQIGIVVKDPGNLREGRWVLVRYGLGEGLIKALQETWNKSVFNLVMIGKMVTGEVSWHNISGPVTIADYAGQSAKIGLSAYLSFLAVVSISLAVLNLLPVPILDGGHLMYYVIEIIRQKPLSERSMEIGQQIGLVLLLLLMVCAFYNDINRLISG